MTCCFFGHRDAACLKEEKLYNAVELLIDNGVKRFMVEHQGGFDTKVYTILKAVKQKYPHIDYAVVLAYIDKGREYRSNETLYPEGLEAVPLKFAISRRNDWMLSQSEVVVAYVNYSHGGAYQFVEKARRKGKKIINIGEYCFEHK